MSSRERVCTALDKVTEGAECRVAVMLVTVPRGREAGGSGSDRCGECVPLLVPCGTGRLGLESGADPGLGGGRPCSNCRGNIYYARLM